jgi:endonuclease/exonuclease/phosphatase family metal-dependent hydrolase
MERDPAFLAECRDLKRELEAFPTLAGLRASREWPGIQERLRRVLGSVRFYGPDRAAPPSLQTDRVKAVHWNVEHGNRFPQIDEALRTHEDLRDADVVFLNEVDLGMARAGNRDVTGELAAALGLHGVWAPLFIETTVGRDDDPVMASGRENEEALFGLGLLSRWPISDVRLVDLPSPERYQFDIERMLGRHAAIVATIDRPEGAFVAVAVHLEVHRTRGHRANQMRTLLRALSSERRPIVLAGDFNSHTFERGRFWDPLLGAVVLILASTRSLEHRLLFPDRGRTREPLFDELKASGFEWNRYVDRAPTLQLRFDRIDELRAFPNGVAHAVRDALAWAERRGRLRLDWFAGRGWSSGRGHTVLGLSGDARRGSRADRRRAVGSTAESIRPAPAPNRVLSAPTTMTPSATSGPRRCPTS